MMVETPSILIIYDHSPESLNAANRLCTDLERLGASRGERIRCAVQDYMEDSRLASNSPQNLILVYSPYIQNLPQRPENIIDQTLDRVVQRRMRSIVAVSSTKATSLPKQWASIPTYDASDRNLAEQVLSEVGRAKLPYSQEYERQSLPQKALSSAGARLKDMSGIVPSIFIALLCVLLVAAAGLGAFVYLHPGQSATSSQGSATAKALASKATSAYQTKTVATASSQPSPTPDPNLKDRQQELSDTTKAPPTIGGFQKNDAWNTVAGDAATCAYDNVNYKVVVTQAAQYAPCLATGPSYKNFALQVTMDIKGDAGGIIFRSTNNNNTYYRLAINQIYTTSTDTPAFTLVLCDKGACSTNSTNGGAVIDSVSAKVDKQPITLTVIARDKNIDVYANKKFVHRFSDGTDTAAGQVGVYAADLNNSTTVNFSDLKIWSLDSK